ncbi:hypothetical protein J3R83DRAFT_3647 [Lanmaoa asiatica]|nr:hypothetical protein J3R83DRAFT_3647 [Lanmaoa asiatica]
MDGGLGRQASTSQANRSLASRIQMNGSPSNDVVNTTHSTASRFPSPQSRLHSVNRATGDASLIPPVEVLSQPPESSPPTPTSLAPASEPVDGHSPMSSTPLMNTTTIRTSRLPTPLTVTTRATSREPTGSITSSAVVDAMMEDLQPSPSAVVATDSLVARQERLQAISTNLANLASSLPPASQSSSSPGPPASWANDNTPPSQSSQSQHSSIPVVLRHPYLVNQSSMNTNDSSLALVQEHQTQGRAVIEAFSNLNSTINAVHRAQD